MIDLSWPWTLPFPHMAGKANKVEGNEESVTAMPRLPRRRCVATTSVILLLLALSVLSGPANAQDLYVSNSGNNTISRITPGGTVTTFASLPGTGGATGLAFDTTGNLYAAFSAPDDIIYKSTPSGDVSPFASGLSDPRYLAFGPAQATAAPEPGSVALLTVGLSLAGLVARRSRH